MEKKTSGNLTLASPVAKFFIGFFASLSAICFPRLSAMLAHADVTNGALSYQFFPMGYLMVALGTAVVLGLVVAIFEWGTPKSPRDTFMSALGIPALLAGAFNTSSGISTIKETRADASRLVESVLSQSNIPKTDTPTKITPLDENAGTQPSSEFHLDQFLGIPAALAGDSVETQASSDGAGYAVQVEQPRYVVVLEKAKTKEEALVRASQLRKSVPNAQAIQTDSGFYVIQPGAKTGTEATLEALKLKRKQLNPSLLRVAPNS